MSKPLKPVEDLFKHIRQGSITLRSEVQIVNGRVTYANTVAELEGTLQVSGMIALRDIQFDQGVYEWTHAGSRYRLEPTSVRTTFSYERGQGILMEFQAAPVA